MTPYIIEEKENLLNFDAHRAEKYLKATLLNVEELITTPVRGIRAMYNNDKTQVCLCLESCGDMYHYSVGSKFLFIYDIFKTRLLQWGPINDTESCRSIH